MRMRIAAAVLLAAGGLWWAQSASGQVQSTPGFGSGVVQVQGTVDIGRLPPVDVAQRGDWKVSLATVADTRVVNTPSVTIALPPFVAEGGRYVVTWANGEREGLAVGQVAGAWVRAAVNGPPRWVNLSSARAIEQAP